MLVWLLILAPSGRQTSCFRQLGRVPEFAAVKIVVKLEKAGQVLAKSELEIDNLKHLNRRTWKAFNQFYKDHPDLSLFEEGVYLKFEKAQSPPRRRRPVVLRKFES